MNPYQGVVTGLNWEGSPPSFPIFLGDAKTMNLKAAPLQVTGDPLDLTSCTAISVVLQNADGTYLTLTLTSGVSITTAILGKFSVALSSAQSALLNVGENQTFEVTFTIGSVVQTVQFFQALSVFQVE